MGMHKFSVDKAVRKRALQTAASWLLMGMPKFNSAYDDCDMARGFV
jgi:hypothetical protein